MSNFYVWITVAVIALVTALLRFLPFVIWGDNRKTPKIIEKLGKTLPYAIMGMLVVFCLKSVSITAYPHGIPELIGVLTVAGLHIW